MTFHARQHSDLELRFARHAAVAPPSFVQGDTEPVAARIGEHLVEPVERRDRPTRLRVGRAERDDPELYRSQRTSIASLPCVC
jgi:hypothetical protein